jgi:ribulose-phosphate 3-epimerase
MIQILPAILATNPQDYLKRLRIAETLADWIQVDIEDQKFAPIKTIGADTVASYPTKLKIEAQLMVGYPENFIDDFIKAGVQRIVVPVENTAGLKEVIKHIKNHGVQVGVSLNPETPIEELAHLISDLDLVLTMTVYPGPSGQNFRPEVLPKIATLHKNYPELNIEVDGGIDPRTVRKVIRAGANILVAGSYIFDAENPAKAIKELKEAANLKK